MFLMSVCVLSQAASGRLSFVAKREVVLGPFLDRFFGAFLRAVRPVVLSRGRGGFALCQKGHQHVPPRPVTGEPKLQPPRVAHHQRRNAQEPEA